MATSDDPLPAEAEKRGQIAAILVSVSTRSF